MKRKYFTIHSALFILLLLTSCGMTDRRPAPTITVSIEPLRYFTEKIAGDRFQVATMVPRGSSPETFEPTAKQMVSLSGSQLFLKVGSLGFEQTWMSDLKLNVPHMIVVNSSEGIKRIDADGSYISDPHTWMSASNALAIAENIYKALVLVSSKDSAYFRQNLDELKQTIASTDATIREKLDTISSRSFVIHHPAMTFFALDYGLNQIAIEQDGHEPSAQTLEGVINQAREEGAKVLLTQKELDSRNIGIVAKATGTSVKEINPLGYDWPKEMLTIADILAGANNK